MDDPGRLLDRHPNELQHPTMAVRPDGEKPLLTVVVVLDQPDGVGLGVVDVGIVDAVPTRRGRHLHTSRVH